ncbi:hypothetical protein YC2023_120139 [Brassica napus]
MIRVIANIRRDAIRIFVYLKPCLSHQIFSTPTCLFSSSLEKTPPCINTFDLCLGRSLKNLGSQRDTPVKKLCGHIPPVCPYGTVVVYA